MLHEAFASGVSMATNPRAKSSADLPKAQRIPLAPGTASDDAHHITIVQPDVLSDIAEGF